MDYKTIVNSGEYALLKLTKPQVKNIIKRDGLFHGFMCGNNVNPFHIVEGWRLGSEFKVKSIDAFENQIKQLELGLTVYTPELGTYSHYYQIINENGA